MSVYLSIIPERNHISYKHNNIYTPIRGSIIFQKLVREILRNLIGCLVRDCKLKNTDHEKAKSRIGEFSCLNN